MSKIEQLRGSVYHIIDPIFDPVKTFNKIVNKADKLFQKVTLNDILKTVDSFKFFINAFKIISNKHFGAGITQTNNEIKDIMKVMKSLEKRILFKGTRKITNQ